jgi:predicted dithiol-disulfide oxidoreductase (DUF899 family)
VKTARYGLQRNHPLFKRLQENDTQLVLISRAPWAKIEKFRAQKGWIIPWYSSYGSRFNFDFHVSFDESVCPIEYNYRSLDEHKIAGTFDFFDRQTQPYELPGLSSFIQHDKDVFHTYSMYARGCEDAGGFHYLLDMTASGRQHSKKGP